jgi:DNA-binding NtrC family response regulator
VKRGLAEGIIHIVDDEPDILNIAADALRNSGYEVHSFSNPSEAFIDIEECGGKTSMLITDIRMPGHSGFELARQARMINPNLPVVFMTAFEVNLIEFEKIFPSLKVNDLLQKPFHIDKLVGLVKNHVR